MSLFWFAAAVWYSVRASNHEGKLKHYWTTSRPEPVALLIALLIIVVIALVPSWLWASLRLENPFIQLLGAVITLISTVWILWARWALAEMWSGRPMVQTEHQLHTDGPYGITRHPIYSGLTGMMLGTTMVVGFGWMLAVLVGVLIFIMWRIRDEEKLMIDTFGDRYRVYRQQVPTLIPSLRQLFGYK